MTKTMMENAYSPSSNVIHAQADDSFWAANLRCMVLFNFGTIVGLLIARCFQSGVENTLLAIQSMTVYSAGYLFVFACSCFLCTLF